MRWLLLCLVVSGCDWTAAERQARCNAGDRAACDGGTGGGAGGGSAIGLTLGPIGLFPRGDAGALSLATNTPDGGQVAWFDARGARVAGGQRYADRIISAYADGVSTPMLAAIVQGATPSLHLLFEDGGAKSTATPGQHVMVFFTDLGVFASVWTTGGGGYAQLIYPADLVASPEALGFENCEVTFHDLEVLRAGEGALVAIAYSAGSCTGRGVAEGIDAGSGVQSISSVNVRAGFALSGATRVGRFLENGDAGMDVCGHADGGTSVFLERFDWNRATSVFTLRARRFIDTAGTIALGDVSGGVIAGQSTDRVRVQGASVDDGGFTPGSSTVFAAAPFLGWVRALGPGIAGSNVTVLRQGNSVFVAYLVDDGGTSLVRLDATSGIPTP